MQQHQIKTPTLADYPPFAAVRPLSTAEQELILHFVHHHARGSIAYSALQAGLDYFVDEQLGCLAFMPLTHAIFARGGLHVVIGDPIAAVEDYEAILDRYLAQTTVAATVFLEVSQDFAKILSARGYPVNELGVEWELDLQEFDFDLPGQDYSHLRRWRNKAQKSGVEIFEGRISELVRECGDELDELNCEWLKRKGGHEFVGLTRPLSVDDHPLARYFWAKKDGRLISLAIFDPMLHEGHAFGYLHNLSRTLADAPHGTNDLLVLKAMEKFKAEGREVLSLGLSPFAELTDADYPSNPVGAGLFRFMYEHCQFVYPFKGNYFHKEKYRGRSFKAYISAVPALNLYRILGVFKAAQVL